VPLCIGFPEAVLKLTKGDDQGPVQETNSYSGKVALADGLAVMENKTAARGYPVKQRPLHEQGYQRPRPGRLEALPPPLPPGH